MEVKGTHFTSSLTSLAHSLSTQPHKKQLKSKDFLLCIRTTYGEYCFGVCGASLLGPVAIYQNEYLLSNFVSQLSEFTLHVSSMSLGESERKPLGVLYLLAERIFTDVGVHSELLVGDNYGNEMEKCKREGPAPPHTHTHNNGNPSRCLSPTLGSSSPVNLSSGKHSWVPSTLKNLEKALDNFFIEYEKLTAKSSDKEEERKSALLRLIGAGIRCNRKLRLWLPSNSPNPSTPSQFGAQSPTPPPVSRSLQRLASLLATPLAENAKNKDFTLSKLSKSQKKSTIKCEKICLNAYAALALGLLTETDDTNSPLILGTFQPDVLFQQLFLGGVMSSVPAVCRSACRCLYLLTCNNSVASGRRNQFATRCCTYFKSVNKNSLPHFAGDDISALYFLRSIGNCVFGGGADFEESTWQALYASLLRVFEDPRPMICLEAVMLLVGNQSSISCEERFFGAEERPRSSGGSMGSFAERDDGKGLIQRALNTIQRCFDIAQKERNENIASAGADVFFASSNSILCARASEALGRLCVSKRSITLKSVEEAKSIDRVGFASFPTPLSVSFSNAVNEGNIIGAEECMGEEALLPLSKTLDTCSMLSSQGWDERVAFACIKALIWVAPVPTNVEISLIGSQHEGSTPLDNNDNATSSSASGSSNSVNNDNNNSSYGYRGGRVKNNFLPSAAKHGDSIDLLWNRMTTKLLENSGINVLTSVVNSLQQRILESAARAPSKLTRDVFQNNCSSAISHNLELPPHALIPLSLSFLTHILRKNPSERRAKLLFNFWDVCCRRDVGGDVGDLMLCCRSSILASIYRVLDSFGGNIGGGSAVNSSIYIFLGKHFRYLSGIPTSHSANNIMEEVVDVDGSKNNTIGESLLDLEYRDGVGREKWVNGGSLKSIVGRLITALHSETGDISIGAALGAAKIITGGGECKQTDYLYAKECLKGSLKKFLQEERRWWGSTTSRRVVEESLAVMEKGGQCRDFLS